MSREMIPILGGLIGIGILGFLGIVIWLETDDALPSPDPGEKCKAYSHNVTLDDGRTMECLFTDWGAIICDWKNVGQG